jgi:tetratricopeptide (TPR) repeat protein
LLGDLLAAHHHDELALALDQRLLDQSGMAIVHNNLAEVLLQMGRPEEATQHLELVLAHRHEEEVSQGLVGLALVNMSKARLRLGLSGPAFEALDEGRRLLRESGVQQVMGESDRQQAELLLHSGRAEQAIDWCVAALSNARAMGAELEEAQSLRLLGRLRMSMGDPESARRHLRESVRLAKGLGAEYERAMGLLALCELYERWPVAGSGRGNGRFLADQAVTALKRCGAERDLVRALELRTGESLEVLSAWGRRKVCPTVVR